MTKTKKHIVSVEWLDGSGFRDYFDNTEEAEARVNEVTREFCDARVWLNDNIVQRGYVADDERNES